MTRSSLFPICQVCILAVFLCCPSCKLFGSGARDDGKARTTAMIGAVRIVMTEQEYERYYYYDYDPTKMGIDHRKALFDGEVVGLNLQGANIDESATLIRQYPDAASAIRIDLPDLCESEVRDALKEAGVKYLSIYVWGFNVESVSCLKKLKVDELYITWTRANDSVIQPLRKLDNLRELNLEDTEITDVSLEFIAEIEDLRTLRLGKTKVSDKGIEYIAGLKKLEKLRRLDLSLTEITNDSLSLLSALGQLRELDLQGTAVSKKGFEHFAKMKNLRYLKLNHAVVTDDCVEPLSKLKQLKRLEIRNVQMSIPARAELEDALPNVKIESGGMAIY